jgi:PAS domain S-box-containing protein
MLDKLRGAALRLLGASFASYEARFRATFEHAAVGMAHTTIDGRCLEVNDRLCEITGYPRPELMQLHSRDFTPPEDWAQDAEQRRRVLAGEIDSCRRQKRYLRKDGSLVWVAVTGWLARRPDGRPDYFIATIEDITERKEIEERLRLSEERYRMAVEAGRLGTFDWDIDPDIMYWDERSLAAMGLPPGTTLDYAHSLEFAHPDDRAGVAAAIERALDPETTEPFVHEWRSLHPDGTTRWTETQGRAHFTGEGRERRAYRLVGTARDITRRKRAEEHIKLLMREVSHRSKNLLTVVQALARHTANEVDPQMFAERFGQRLAALAASHDLLVKSDWQGADVADLVRSQLGHLGDLVGTRATFEGASLRLGTAPAQAIGMALHELATNAVKYGALSNDHGRVRIAWHRLANGGAPHVRLVWSEHDGPPIQPPSRRGFGHTVMVGIVEHELDASVRLSYAPSGVVWEMTAPAQRLEEGN